MREHPSPAVDAIAPGALPPDATSRIGVILERLRHKEGALLPILHAIQDQLGFIPEAAVAPIADALNLSRAEVHGVLTFYHDFRSAPPARHVVRLCRAEACQSMGADALLAHAEQALGCSMHGASADGNYALEPVYCLGHCAASPALMIGEAVHARVTAEKFDRLIGKTKEAA